MGRVTFLGGVLVTALLVLTLGFLAPRPMEKVCTTVLDCGFDVGGTDMKDVKPYGYPFISKKTETTRKYNNYIDVVSHTESAVMSRGVILNILSWGTITATFIFAKKAFRKHANNRN
jgi:hypothetical protein